MSWETVKLGEVLTHRKGFITISDSEKYKLCRVQLHRKGVLLREIVSGATIRTKKQQLCKANDFIVAEMDAKVGGYGFIPIELEGAIVSSHYYLFEVNENRLRKDFLAVLNKTKTLQSQIKATGSTNYASVRPSDVLAWEIPLPTIEEQERIVEKIQTVETSKNQISTELDRQLALVKELRQAYLREAMQGKLAPQDSTDEPAEILLEKIKAEKEKLAAEKQIKQDKPLPPIKPEEIPFEIPSNWTWCRFPEVLALTNNSIRRGPFGSSITKDMFVPKSEKATKVYEQKNAIYKDFKLGNYFIELESHPNLKSFLANSGDILISCAGTIGETYLLPEAAPSGVINQALLKIRLNNNAINNQYFINFFHIAIKGKINDDAKGSAMKNLSSIGYLKQNLLIPLPPLAEQERIVAKLEKLMKFCDELEANIKEARANADRLLQTALKEALEPT